MLLVAGALFCLLAAPARAQNRRPLSAPGSDRTTRADGAVTLDGAGSSDPDGDTLRYEWLQNQPFPGDEAVSLSAASSPVTTFTPPIPGVYSFTLVVRDPQGALDARVLKLTAALPGVTTGLLTTFLGGYLGDGGPAARALISTGSLALTTGALLVSHVNPLDAAHGRIRSIDLAAGTIAALAGEDIIPTGDGGQAKLANLSNPRGMAVEPSRNVLIAAGNRVRRIDLSSGTISTIAGADLAGFSGDGGQAVDASLDSPAGVLLDADGALLILDTGNHRIRRVDPASGTIVTTAGDGSSSIDGNGGQATDAGLPFPRGAAVGPSGDLFVSCSPNTVRKIDAMTRVITRHAGNETAGHSGDGGDADAASVEAPGDLAFDEAGNLYVHCQTRIRMVDTAGKIHTVAGGGVASLAAGALATNVAISAAGMAVATDGTVYFLDGGQAKVWKVAPATNRLSLTAGSGAVDPAGFDAMEGKTRRTVNPRTPAGLALDRQGNLLLTDSSQRVYRVDRSTGSISRFAGGGIQSPGDGFPAAQVSLSSPTRLETDPSGNVFVREADRVRRIDAASGVISTVAGGNCGAADAVDGEGASRLCLSSFYTQLLAFDPIGNSLLLPRTSGPVRRVDLGSGIVTTEAGSGPGTGGLARAQYLFVIGLGRGPGRKVVTVQRGSTGEIKEYDPETLEYRHIAGTGCIFTGDGGDWMSCLNGALDATFDSAGNGYVVGGSNLKRVLRLDFASKTISTIAGTGTGGYSGDTQTGTNAQVGSVSSVALSTDERTLYFADDSFGVAPKRLRKIDLQSRVIDTVTTWTLETPRLAVGPDGTVYAAADTDANGLTLSITAVDPTTGGKTTIAVPDLPGNGVAVDAAGFIYVAGLGRIHRIHPATKAVSHFAGTGTGGFSGDGGPATTAAMAPADMIVSDGGLVFIDQVAAKLRRIDLTTGIISTLAGYGINGSAPLVDDEGALAADTRFTSATRGITVNGRGDVYLSGPEPSGFARVIDEASGRIFTLTGTSGAGFDLAHDLFGNVYEIRGDTIERIDAVTRNRTAIAGGGALTGENVAGASASLPGLSAGVLAVDQLDGSLFIARPGQHRVLVLRSPSVGNRPPIAAAGASRSAAFNTVVTLDGTSSRDPDNDPLTYQWTQLAGSAASLSDASNPRPAFTADATDFLTFRLTVTDGRGGSSSADVSIQVLFEPDTTPPTAVLSLAPSASVTRSSPVTATATFNELLRAAPTLVFNRIAGSGTIQGGAMSRFGSTNTYTYRFTPLAENTGSYQLQLSAADFSGNALVAQPPNNILNVNVRSNAAPLTDAGTDRTVVVDTQVVLDGSATTDPDGDPVTYSWTAVSGPASVFLSPVARPGFTPSAAGTYVFRLTATDDRGASASDTVEVLVTPPLPDLRITRVQAPLSAFTGGSIALVASVANAGSASVRDFFNVGFYLSTDAVISVADTFLGSQGATSSLAPEGVIDVTGGPFLAPAALAPGAYFAGAIADAGGAVLELSKENNSRAAAVATTISAPPRDDRPGSAAATTAADEIPLGDPGLAGLIEAPGDVDFFRFQGVAGRAVVLSVQGAEAALLLTLLDTTGTAPIALDNGATRNSTISRIPFTPESSGTYFLKIEFPSGSRTGGYSVTVRLADGGGSTSDDHPNSPADLGVLDTIEVNGLARPGALETRTDVDYFRFGASPGNVYVIELTPGSLAAGLFTLFAADGSTQLSEARGGGSATLVLPEFRPASPGVFFVRAASGDGQASGSYSVGVASRADVLRSPPAVTLTSSFAGGQLQARIDGSGSTIPLANLNLLVGYDGASLALVNTQRGGAAIAFDEQTNQFLPTLVSINLSAQPPSPLPSGLLEILSFQPAPRAAIGPDALTVVSVAALGGGNTAPIQVFRPTADSGVPQKLVASAVIAGIARYPDPLEPSRLVSFLRLDGRASSDPNSPARPLGYSWTASPAVTLSDPRAPTPTFVPPAPGRYTFELTVSNGILRSPPSRVQVSVDEITLLPFAVPRLALPDTGERAGPDEAPLTVEAGRPVTLDARESTHPSTALRDTLTYSWTDRLGSGAATIPANAMVTITPTVPGPQEIDLVATDTAGRSSAPSRLRFAVRSADNVPARLSVSANAPGAPSPGLDLGDVPLLGGDRALRVTTGTNVTLTAVAVDADVQPGVPGAQRVQFFWRQVAGPSVSFSQNGGVSPSSQLRSTLGLAPGVPGLYEFECRLVEADSGGSAIGSESTRRIQLVVEAPGDGVPTAAIALSPLQAKGAVAWAAPSAAAPGAVLRLDGSGSSSAREPGPLAYRWLQVAGPDVVLSNPYAAVTTFVVPETRGSSLLAFSLIVDDATGEHGPAAVASLPVTTLPAVEPNGELVLSAGVNFVGLPLDAPAGQPARTAGQLLQSAGSPFLAFLDAGRFRTVLPGTEGATRVPAGAEGFVLTVPRPRRVTLAGRRWAASVFSRALATGLNLVAYPRGAAQPRNLSALARAAGASFIVSSRGGTRYDVWLEGMTPDTPLREGAAYLLHVPASRTIDLRSIGE